MIVVFGSFALEEGRVIQMFGTGLAVAVLLDATLVRMVLVPATMELLGARNWWMPAWLDRLLPKLRVEGRRATRRGTERIPQLVEAGSPQGSGSDGHEGQASREDGAPLPRSADDDHSHRSLIAP
jgi:hypothetical protein